MVGEPQAEEQEDPLVTIGDRKVPLSQVTDQDQSEMTPEEYTVQYNTSVIDLVGILQSAGREILIVME